MSTTQVKSDLLKSLWEYKGKRLPAADPECPDHIFTGLSRVRDISKLPETVRIIIGSEFVEFAVSLGTTDPLELARNPEYAPPADKTFISFLPPKIWGNKIGEEAFLLEGSSLYRMFKKNGFVSVGKDQQFPYDLSQPFNDGETKNFMETLFLPVVTGIIRAFNVLEPRFLEQVEVGVRPPGHRFNGMPFSKIKMSMINLRGHSVDAEGEHSATDQHGVRFHFVRGHYMSVPGRTEKSWRRSHWRGDPNLGTARKIYNAT